jgi:hypothetical protein
LLQLGDEFFVKRGGVHSKKEFKEFKELQEFKNRRQEPESRSQCPVREIA